MVIVTPKKSGEKKIRYAYKKELPYEIEAEGSKYEVDANKIRIFLKKKNVDTWSVSEGEWNPDMDYW